MNQRGITSFITIFIALAVIAGFFFGYFYGQSKEVKPIDSGSQITEAKSSPSNQTLNSNYPYGVNYQILTGCTGKECLFKSPSEDGVVEGFAILEGYFHTYESDNYGTKVTCNSLLVTGGNETLINSFRTQIKKGNSLNKLDKNNNLMVNIGLNNLDANTKSIIQSSTSNHKIQLDVIRITPQPMGASTCTSFVDIIDVKSLNK